MNPNLFLLLLLGPILIWLGVVYVGSLFSLLLQSFFSIDEFTGLIVKEFTLKTYISLFSPSNFDIIIRTTSMAFVVTIVSAVIAFPIAFYMAMYTSKKTKAIFYVAVMVPLWSSYLVRVYSWKLILAKEGILNWLLELLHIDWLLDLVLHIPVIGGGTLSTSYIGTMIVFVYIWLPFMILPIQAALEKVPTCFPSINI
jgi:putative spermidine/putrescine transport system permease protein